MTTLSQSTAIAIILIISILSIVFCVLLICWYHQLLCFEPPTDANNHNNWNFGGRQAVARGNNRQRDVEEVIERPPRVYWGQPVYPDAYRDRRWGLRAEGWSESERGYWR